MRLTSHPAARSAGWFARLVIVITAVLAFPAAAFLSTHATDLIAGTSDPLTPPPLDISITNGGYASQVVRIPVGTTVTWTNLEGVHTTTSRDGLWDSDVLVEGETFTYEFDDVGLYPYFDTIHDWPRGTIQVVHSLAEIDIHADPHIYRSGETMTVGLAITNPGDAVQASVAVDVERSDGTTIPVAFVPSVQLPGGLNWSREDWMAVTLPALPRGEYTWRAEVDKAPEGDRISLDRAPVTFGRATQTDWSGGPGVPGPLPLWTGSFESCIDIAWRPLTGRLSLPIRPLETARQSVIATDADRPTSVAIGDLDGDGLDDVITSDPIYDTDVGAIYWY